MRSDACLRRITRSMKPCGFRNSLIASVFILHRRCFVVFFLFFSVLVLSLKNQEKAAEKIGAVAAVVNGKLIERTAQYAPVFYLQELLSKFKLKLNIIEDKGFGLSIE